MSSVAYGPFDDILLANAAYAERYTYGGLEARAAKLLALLTCIDSRLDPLRMAGLVPGDAKIFRNAGARVTDDVLRGLVVAHYLLGAARFMVIAHTHCAMAAGSDESLHEAISSRGGPDTRGTEFLATDDQEAALHEDVERVRSSPFLGALTVGGFVFDLETGLLRRVC